MRSRPQKCLRSSDNGDGRDRLSELPDHVIVHILSLMPTLDAVRTVLLRRFGNLWTMVHTLRFDLENYLEDIFVDFDWDTVDVEQFYLYVRNVLTLHKRSSINKFYLRVYCVLCENSSEKADDIKMWLRFAFDRQAAQIEFRDGRAYRPANCSGLPNNLLSESLVTLELNDCKFLPELKVNLRSLKKLLLRRVTMCDEAFQQFMSGCPSLQELGVVDPYVLDYLSFSAPNVDKLSLGLTEYASRYHPRLLNCPNLKSLDLETDGLLPNVLNVSSVRYVNIKYFQYEPPSEYRRAMLQMFLEKLEATEVLKLSYSSSEKFLHAIKDSSLLQNRWKRVILTMEVFCQDCLLGLYQLMKTSRHLEELTIYTKGDSKASKQTCPLKFPSPCVMPQLKTVTLHGYQKSWNRRVQLERLLRKSAPSLDKLVIIPMKQL